MTVAFWCLLAAAIMPYVFTLIAKFGGEGRYNNRAPRAYLDSQKGLAQRADWAQRNSFEALPIFVAAVLAGAVAGVADQWMAILGLGFIAFRVLYGFCYLRDWASTRSIVWSGGYLCCLALLVLAALAAPSG